MKFVRARKGKTVQEYVEYVLHKVGKLADSNGELDWCRITCAKRKPKSVNVWMGGLSETIVYILESANNHKLFKALSGVLFGIN